MCDLKFFLINIIGIVTCVIWLFFIDNYKALNTEKFKVINELENKLPVKPFNEEWQRLKKNKKYRESTKLEKAFPYGFIFIYGVPVLKLILLFIFNR